jgi:hypothetical protein
LDNVEIFLVFGAGERLPGRQSVHGLEVGEGVRFVLPEQEEEEAGAGEDRKRPSLFEDQCAVVDGFGGLSLVDVVFERDEECLVDPL